MSLLVMRLLHGLTLLAAVLSAVGWWRGMRPALATWSVRAGFAAGVAGLVLRTVVSGHLPIFGTLENTWTASTVVLGTIVAAELRGGAWGRSARCLAPWAVALMLLGFKARFEPVPLTISEQSVWVDLHVILAWAGYVSLLWAGSLGIRELTGPRRRAAKADPGVEIAVFRLMSVGYVFLTGMILAGSWYLFVLFATFWRWEVVGSLALLSWVGYSIVMHGWLIQGWRGQRLYWAVAIMLVPLTALYWVWAFFPGTYHFFDIPLMTPY